MYSLVICSDGLQNEKTGDIAISENVSGDVPKIGLEPTYLAVPEPKSGVSTNSTTWAKVLSLDGFLPFCQSLKALTDLASTASRKVNFCLH